MKALRHTIPVILAVALLMPAAVYGGELGARLPQPELRSAISWDNWEKIQRSFAGIPDWINDQATSARQNFRDWQVREFGSRTDRLERPDVAVGEQTGNALREAGAKIREATDYLAEQFRSLFDWTERQIAETRKNLM